jgi:twitching motility protein PilT
MDITELLAFTVKNKASDLHISAGLPPMIRVHGDVRRINLPALAHKDVHGMVYDIMNDAQRKQYEEFLETDFSFEIPNLARFRVNAFNQNRGAAAVFRVIPSKVLTLEELNCPKIFKDISSQPAASCWSPAPPARASPPRWRRWSTTSTKTNTATSSPSRTRSNSS